MILVALGSQILHSSDGNASFAADSGLLIGIKMHGRHIDTLEEVPALYSHFQRTVTPSVVKGRDKDLHS